MTSAFENLAGPGRPLQSKSPDAREFSGLQRPGLAGLKDDRLPVLPHTLGLRAESVALALQMTEAGA